MGQWRGVFRSGSARNARKGKKKGLKLGCPSLLFGDERTDFTPNCRRVVSERRTRP